jgi:bleomycin hydrolase
LSREDKGVTQWSQVLLELFGEKMMLNRFQKCLLSTCLVSAFALSSDALANPFQTVVVENQVPATESATEPAKQPYNIQIEKSCAVNEVQSQGSTGTCWSFATASFLESEMLRMNRGVHRLSEMFIVKNIYRDKARNFLLRKGKAQFSEGALAHDYLNAASRYGLVPEQVYNGLEEGEKKHDHSELATTLTGMMNGLVKRKSLSGKWENAVSGVLDAYLGSSPDRFEYQGRSYSPQEFASALGYQRDNYVSLTSYSHHPFGKPFVLEIPDNFSNGSFQNVPVDDLIATIDNAIANGYTVAWDGDVSEKGFSSSKGLAILPVDPSRKDAFENIGPEKTVTQADRQKTFMSYSTTDDHLMHLVGISRDAAGNKYYMIKNSWGEVGPYKGYLHMSEAYARLKTVAIIVHQDVGVSRADQNQR